MTTSVFGQLRVHPGLYRHALPALSTATKPGVSKAHSSLGQGGSSRRSSSPGSQRYGFRQHLDSQHPLQRVGGNDIDRSTEKVTELPGNASEGHKPDTVICVDKEVDVAPPVVIALVRGPSQNRSDARRPVDT